MIALALLSVLPLLHVVFASTDATCDVAYGRPNVVACLQLLHSMNDPQKRFMGPPNINRPYNVDDIEWSNRRMLPNVHSKGTSSANKAPSNLHSLMRSVRNQGDCNIALLSILQLSGSYTWVISSFQDIVGLELEGHGESVLAQCVMGFSPGGFRQIRKLDIPLGFRKTAFSIDMGV